MPVSPPKLSARVLGVDAWKSCPDCGSRSTRLRCAPRPFHPEGLFWAHHSCEDCGASVDEPVPPDPALSTLARRQDGKQVAAGQFERGRDRVLLRHRVLMHGTQDLRPPFLSVHDDGRMAATRGCGWAVQLPPDGLAALLARVRRLEGLNDALGRYESHQFAVRTPSGWFTRTVGFDWEMGAELNYGTADREVAVAAVDAMKALSYEAGFRPLSFRRDLAALEALGLVPSP